MPLTEQVCRPIDLLPLLDSFPQFSVAVVGDLMLDRYIWGSASRISPEAPVPVITVSRETSRLGGAANVAANLTGLGARATVYGTVGMDQHAETLLEGMTGAGIGIGGVERTGSERQTTVKTRVIAGGQQIVRVDREELGPLAPEMQKRVTDRLLSDMKNGAFQAIIFEDYAKGLLNAELMQQVSDTASALGIPTALDPHPSHFEPVLGLSLMTPNRSEAFALSQTYCPPATGVAHEDHRLIEVCVALLSKWQVESLLVTLGSDGMLLLGPEHDLVHIPTRAREVYDVSGAGDTVTASFVLAKLAGATPPRAAAFSNHAAGIVVAKTGTIPVTADELRLDLESADE